MKKTPDAVSRARQRLRAEMSERADTLLAYGETGTGKTAQIGQAAVWEFKRTGRITRLISADSGWDPIEELVAGGGKPFGTETASGPVCIEAWNIQYLPNPFPVVVKLSEGAWPRVVTIGAGANAAQKIMLGAPAKDPGGHLLSSDGKTLVGQYAVEGLSTISAMLMQDHIRNLRKIAEDIVGDFSGSVEIADSSGRITNESLKFGKSGRAHYGHVQDFVLLDLVPRFATLPVARVIWTAHEAKGTE